MYNTKKITNIFLLSYVAISWFFTFVITYDFDKISCAFISFFLFVMVISELSEKTKSKFLLKNNSKLKIFLFLACLLYLSHYFYYDILINKEVLTLLSIYLTVIMFAKYKAIIHFDLILKFYGSIFLISSLLTIKESPLIFSGYTYETGAGGILSSFILFSVFLCFFLLKERVAYKYISYISLFFILALQIRGVVLSVIITFLTYKGIQKTTFIYLLFGCLFIILASIAMPESRLFSTETSGRLIHWEIILGEFNFNIKSLLIGMGDNFSTDVLINHGVGEFMAAPHNEYIRYFVDLGLIGFILFVLIIDYLYKYSENKFVIIVILQQMITDNIFTYFHNYLFFILMLAFYKPRIQNI